MSRIYFNAWGSKINELNLPAYAVKKNDYESKVAFVTRAIARKNNLEVVTLSSQGQSLTRGKPESNHYQMTLGHPCKGGGYTPVAQIWLSIPCTTQK